MAINFLTGSAIAAIAKETLVPIVTKIVLENSKELLGIFGKSHNEETRQLIFNATQKYVGNYVQRHGILKVLGMREPIFLDSVYTNVRLLDEYVVHRFESIENLEKAFRESQGKRFQLEESKKYIEVEVANKEQYLMVLGAPGSGKSTLLRKIGLEALKGKKGELKVHDCIPVFLELKRFNESDIDIQTLIADEFETCGFPNSEKFTELVLKKGKLLILLDGLDEVPINVVTEITEKIQDFVDRYHKNRFIASCRTSAYRSRFRRFKDLEITDFDDQQIENFINNWFNSEQDRQLKTAQYCWELLQGEKYRGTKELAQSPLLLTFLCLVYDKSQDFPDNRSVLYREALKILLKEWAAEKRINRDKIYEGLNVELEEILLEEIAYTNFIEDRLFFEQRSLTDTIKTFLASNLNAPKHLDGEAILNAIGVQQGILVERAKGIYSFSHLVLQEYLVAQYIVNENCLKEIVIEYLFDRRWREIFLLTSGLLAGRHGADLLLLLIEEQAKQCLAESSSNVKSLLYWANQVDINTEISFSPIVKRTLAILFALDFDFQPALNLIAFYGYSTTIKKLLDDKEIQLKKIELSTTEKEKIHEYFYAILLLIEAKKSAVRVSSETWSAIEKRLLLVEKDLEIQALEVAQDFFQKANVKMDFFEGQLLQVISVPTKFSISPQSLVFVANNQSVEEAVKMLTKHSKKISDTQSEYTGIILYRKPPTIGERLQIATSRMCDNFILIPIPLAEIERALPDSKSCEATLTEYINRYIKRANFFDDKNSISDTSLFFGRSKFFNQIKEELLRHQSIGLFGLRKSGKTSILIQLSYILIKEYPVICIDLQRYTQLRWGADLFNRIITELHTLANNFSTQEVPKFEKFQSGTLASELTVKFIEQFCELAETIRINVNEINLPILCFLDEIESIFPTPQHSPQQVEEFNACFGAFRVLCQEQRNLAILVSGVRPDCNRVNHWSQEGVRSNPVFQFFKEIFLPLFSEQETVDMLTTLASFMKLELNPEISIEIHHESGGHPYIARQLANLFYQEVYQKEIDPFIFLKNDLNWEDWLLDFDDLSYYFEESIWKELKNSDFKSAMKVLELSAASGEVGLLVREEFLIKNLQSEFTKLECSQAINWLLSVGLIARYKKENHRQYKIVITHFLRWLHGYKFN